MLVPPSPLSLCMCACAHVMDCVCVSVGGVDRAPLQVSWLPTRPGPSPVCVVRSCLYRDVIFLVTAVRYKKLIQAYRYIHIYFLEPERC